MQHLSSMYLIEVDEEFELLHSFILAAGAEKRLRERETLKNM